MFKCFWFFAAILLMCEIHQLKARYIISLKLADINEHKIAAEYSNIVANHELKDVIRGIRSTVDVFKNCRCLTVTNRCAKNDSCLKNTANPSN